MILDTVVEHFKYTTAKNDEGMPVKSWVSQGCLSANVQPENLTSAQLLEHGTDYRSANSKLMFTNLDGKNIAINDRIVEDSEKYTVIARNKWPRHIEFLLLPVQGGQ